MILSSLTVPLTVQGDTLGAPLAITLPSLGRTVGLRYRCGAKSGTVAAPGRLTRAEWTPPLTLAEEYPNRDKIPVKLILDAYENGKIEGSREKQVLLSIPEGFHPTVTLRAAPQAGDRFLQGGQALVEVTASGTLGAEIIGCTVRCGDLTGQGQRLRFDLPQAGEIPVTARVTDSRGRSSQAGSAQRVWELAGTAGAIRVLSGSTLAVRTLRQTEDGLEFAAAAPADTWAVPLAVYALKEGSIG